MTFSPGTSILVHSPELYHALSPDRTGESLCLSTDPSQVSTFQICVFYWLIKYSHFESPLDGTEDGSPARNTSTNIPARHSNAFSSKFAAGESSLIVWLPKLSIFVINHFTDLTDIVSKCKSFYCATPHLTSPKWTIETRVSYLKFIYFNECLFLGRSNRIPVTYLS